jgi:hypothetical protein
MNKQVEVGVDEKVKATWREKFSRVDVKWCIVDGFVLYWDKVSQASLIQCQLGGSL